MEEIKFFKASTVDAHFVAAPSPTMTFTIGNTKSDIPVVEVIA